jgi:cyclase
MLRPRLIPALLVNSALHLVKTQAFVDRHYIGDPLNAAYVFSGFEVDELLVLDIDASLDGRCIPLPFVAALARFTSVPLCVGGGIRSLDQIQDLVALGVEKVALSAALDGDLTFLARAAELFGSSTISVVLNVQRDARGEAMSRCGRDGRDQPLMELALACQNAGAGELVLHHMQREGLRCGYDVELLAELNNLLSIPLVALGGGADQHQISELLLQTPLSGVGAGSQFVYAPSTREVLLNYPDLHAWLQGQLPHFQQASA